MLINKNMNANTKADRIVLLTQQNDDRIRNWGISIWQTCTVIICMRIRIENFSPLNRRARRSGGIHSGTREIRTGKEYLQFLSIGREFIETGTTSFALRYEWELILKRPGGGVCAPANLIRKFNR